MEKDGLTVADHLRHQLGIFYWAIQRTDDLEIAAHQLQAVVQGIEGETSPWQLSIPSTVFARWSHLQLTLLLVEAKQALTRLGYPQLPSPGADRAPGGEGSPCAPDVEVLWYGPLT